MKKKTKMYFQMSLLLGGALISFYGPIFSEVLKWKSEQNLFLIGLRIFVSGALFYFMYPWDEE